MNRRNFMGGLFGLVAASPFLFKSIGDPIQRVKLPYNAFYREASGVWIQAPAVESIGTIDSGYRFGIERLSVKHRLTFDKMMIQTAKGETVIEWNFDSLITMNDGDQLTSYVNFTWAGKPLTLEEMVHMRLRNRNGIL